MGISSLSTPDASVDAFRIESIALLIIGAANTMEPIAAPISKPMPDGMNSTPRSSPGPWETTPWTSAPPNRASSGARKK